MVQETKKCMKYLNITMGFVAVILVVLNFSAFFRDIPYFLQDILKCCLVLFVLITCGFILYSFCKIRNLLVAYEMNKKTENDTWVFIHCISFLIFNIGLMIMLGLTEVKEQLKERKKTSELSMLEESRYEWVEFVYKLLYLGGTVQALLYVLILLKLVLHFTKK